MNPLAIALQGVGYGALLMAVQGFAPVPAGVSDLPRYSASIDAGAVQKAHRRQQLEEDEAILAVIQQFVMET